MEENIKHRTQDEMAEERTALAEQRTGMATERTDMAFERTALANSQTFLSYVRTAVATFAAGIGMFEFIDNTTIVYIGIVLMTGSPIIVIIGLIHYLKVRGKIRRYKI